jgi:hypothetical protein
LSKGSRPLHRLVILSTVEDKGGSRRAGGQEASIRRVPTLRFAVQTARWVLFHFRPHPEALFEPSPHGLYLLQPQNQSAPLREETRISLPSGYNLGEIALRTGHFRARAWKRKWRQRFASVFSGLAPRGQVPFSPWWWLA